LLTHLTPSSFFPRTMADKEKPHPLLSKPLFIFSLPTELLNTLTLKGDIAPPDDQTSEPSKQIKEAENSEAGGTGCVTCNIPSFVHLSLQREHFRSDLHKFNLKRKLAGQKSVSAEEFDRMLDGINNPPYKVKTDINNRPQRIDIRIRIRGVDGIRRESGSFVKITCKTQH
jgi:hypothetical protein